nr:MAG TPA: hypothetical protein [Caudoviricetes sp.]
MIYRSRNCIIYLELYISGGKHLGGCPPLFTLFSHICSSHLFFYSGDFSPDSFFCCLTGIRNSFTGQAAV